MTTPENCTPTARCKNYRRCAPCARWRQAKIADAVAAMSRHMQNLFWHRITADANQAAPFRNVAATWRQATDSIAGIWTIEQGEEQGKLHANIITGATAPHQFANLDTWAERVTGNPRHVGAYIAKQSQIPTPQQYAGRTSGRWGPIKQWLLLDEMPAIVQGATLETIHLSPKQHHEKQHQPNDHHQPHLTWHEREQLSQPQPPLDYRQIANAHLPKLLAITSKWLTSNRSTNTNV